jgi:hypothetical protein
MRSIKRKPKEKGSKEKKRKEGRKEEVKLLMFFSYREQ